jgi:hypothetical protein
VQKKVIFCESQGRYFALRHILVVFGHWAPIYAFSSTADGREIELSSSSRNFSNASRRSAVCDAGLWPGKEVAEAVQVPYQDTL